MQEEIEKLLQEIKEKSEKKFGKLQKCCGMYEDYCRCKSNNKTVNYLGTLNETRKDI